MKSLFLSIAGVLVAVLFGLVLIKTAITHPLPAPAPTPAPADEGATITWSVPQMAATLFPGTSSTTVVSFRADQDLSGVVVWITPSLNGVVSASQSSFPAVAANKDYQVTFTLTAPSAFQKRSFGGTIHIRNAGTPPKTYATPLVVNVGTGFGSYSNSTLGVSIDYPTNLFVIDPASPSDPVLIQTSPEDINLGGALPETPTNFTDTGLVIGVASLTSPIFGGDIAKWLGAAYPNSEIDTVAAVTVGGLAGYRVSFKDEVGAGEPLTFVPLAGKVFRISYSSTFALGSQEDQAGLQIYNSMLQSLSFQ